MKNKNAGSCLLFRPSKQLRRVQVADCIRNLLLSWLLAAMIEYLLLPNALRNLQQLNGLAAMSASRLAALTICIFISVSGLTCLRGFKMVSRICLPLSFLLLAAPSLFASFHWAFLAGCMLILLLLLIYSILGWDNRPQPLPDTKKGHIIYPCITMFLAFLFFLFVSFWTIGRVFSFYTPTYDFGIFSQMFYYLKTTGAPMTTLERDGLLSHFAVHVSPIYYLLLPVYCLFPFPATLQLLQAAVITSSVIPLWLIGRHYGLHPPVRMLLCAAGLLYPALSGGAGYDIHENCFLTPLLLWLLYGLSVRRVSITVLSAFLTLMVKEDAAVYVAVIGLYQTVSALIQECNTRKGDLWTGIGLLAAAVGWFTVVTAYLSSKGDGVMTYRYSNFMYGQTSSLFQVVLSVVLCPMKAVFECLDAEKLPFLAQTLLPLLGLPFLTRRYERFILLIPYILVNLMSDYKYQHDIFFQYTFGSTALLLYLTAVNLSDWKHSAATLVTVSAAVVAGSIFFFSTVFPVGIRYPGYCIQYYDSYQQIREILLTIPDDAAVAASTFYTASLSQRKLLYDLDYCSQEHLLESEYVVISKQGQQDIKQIEALLHSHGYILYAQIPETLVIYRSP